MTTPSEPSDAFTIYMARTRADALEYAAGRVAELLAVEPWMDTAHLLKKLIAEAEVERLEAALLLP